MIQLNDDFHEHLDVAKLDAVLDELGVPPMPAELKLTPPAVGRIPLNNSPSWSLPSAVSINVQPAFSRSAEVTARTPISRRSLPIIPAASIAAGAVQP